MVASNMAPSGPSYFADFEHVKILVVILLTLNKSKKISSHFADFEQ